MKKRGMLNSLEGHDTSLIHRIERRLFLRQSLSLGALAMLSGCELTEDESVQKMLTAMSRWNDGAQAALFNPHKLAREYPESAITNPFPFNAYYGEDEIRAVDPVAYKLEVAGLVREKKSWSLPELMALPQTSQITRHICVEGWSAIGKWTGTQLGPLLQTAGLKLNARFAVMHCADNYGGGADMYAYDVNGDGRADVVSSLRGHGYGLAWYEQTASGGWTRHMIMSSPDKAGPEETIAPFSELHVVQMADMDGDGLKDIITGKRWWSHGDLYREEGFQAWPVLYWFKLSRAGGRVTFTPHLIHDNSGIGTDFAVGDVNGDKRPDIVTNARHGAFLFLNTLGARKPGG